MAAERANPEPARIALIIQVRRKPSLADSIPPTMPPTQKKHIVKVKFRLSAEAVQPNSAARGALRTDQP